MRNKILIGLAAYTTWCLIINAKLVMNTYDMYMQLEDASNLINGQADKVKEALDNQIPADQIAQLLFDDITFFNVTFYPPVGYELMKRFRLGMKGQKVAADE